MLPRMTLLLMLAGLSGVAVAEANLRCDTSMVQRGFTLYEVEERCGPPVYEYRRTDYRYPGYFVDVEEWVYESGRNRFRRQLIFENGRLRFIETRRKPRERLAAGGDNY